MQVVWSDLRACSEALDSHISSRCNAVRQNETITVSTQFISELVPMHEFGMEMMSVREMT